MEKAMKNGLSSPENQTVSGPEFYQLPEQLVLKMNQLSAAYTNLLEGWKTSLNLDPRKNYALSSDGRFLIEQQEKN